EGNGFTGTPASVGATSTGLSASVNPAQSGQAVVFTATVAPSPAAGSVAFTDSGTPVAGCGSVPVDLSSGIATCTTSFATAGSHDIQAAYSGDPADSASESPVLTETVNASTGTTGTT